MEYQTFGEVDPEVWSEFLPFQREAPASLLRAAALKWKMLQRENAPLRAVVNGHLMSVDADFYDWIIRLELEKQKPEFQEPFLISDVIHHQLGISDDWIALRIEEMIRTGELEPVTQAPPDGPSYRRILRKCRKSL